MAEANMSSGFSGVYANLPTPFDNEGEVVALDRLENLVEHVIKNGVAGIACCLSSGEFAYLSSAEREAVVEGVLRTVNGRVPVIVGISEFGVKNAVALAQHAEKHGANAVLLLPMEYWPLREKERLRFYERVGKEVSIPLGVYDNPALTHVRLAPGFYQELAEAGFAQVSKDSSGSIAHVADVVAATGGRTKVLHGSHVEMVAAYLYGASGVCTAVASVFPALCVQIDRAARAGRIQEAYQHVQRAGSLFRILKEVTLVRGIKAAAELQGIPLGPVREPLLGITGDQRAKLGQAIKSWQAATEVL